MIPIRVDQINSSMWKLLIGTMPFARRRCWYDKNAITVLGMIRTASTGTNNIIITADMDENAMSAKRTSSVNIPKTNNDASTANMSI
jgi:hypothetical protein